MRILYIVSTFPTVSETFVLSQIAGAVRRGHDVQVYSLHLGDTSVLHPEVLADSLLHRVVVPPRREANWVRRCSHALRLAASVGRRRAAAALRSLNVVAYGREAASLELFFAASPLFKSDPFDIIHCHFGPCGLKALALRRLGAVDGKLVTTFHGYDVNVLPRRRGRQLYDPLFAAGDLFIVGSDFIRGRLLSLGADSSRVVKLPPGVSLARFDFRERRPDPDGSVRLITVGRLEEVKGVEYAIRAMTRLVDRFPRLRYQIVGDGSLRDSLKALVSTLRLEQWVEFLGRQPHDEVSRLCERAHIFVYSGVVGRNGAEEGLGMALLEAQASGLPVIASRVGGVEEAVPSGQSGVLVPPGDADALAEAISHLIQHPELWPGLGRSGRQHVQDNYDLEAINDHLGVLYERLVHDPAPPKRPQVRS